MPKLHLLPIAALPDPRIKACDVTLRITTDRQWGALVPTRIVPRKPSTSSSLVVGGSEVSSYGWLVSVVSARIFKDIVLTFRWDIDSVIYQGGCDHQITIRLLPAADMADPVWSMDEASHSESGRRFPAPSAPVSFFAREGRIYPRKACVDQAAHRVVHGGRDGRISIHQTLDIAPVEMASVV